MPNPEAKRVQLGPARSAPRPQPNRASSFAAHSKPCRVPRQRPRSIGIARSRPRQGTPIRTPIRTPGSHNCRFGRLAIHHFGAGGQTPDMSWKRGQAEIASLRTTPRRGLHAARLGRNSVPGSDRHGYLLTQEVRIRAHKNPHSTRQARAESKVLADIHIPKHGDSTVLEDYAALIAGNSSRSFSYEISPLRGDICRRACGTERSWVSSLVSLLLRSLQVSIVGGRSPIVSARSAS